jgi:tetratricopeptide (TPR) repeat protein
MLSSTVIGEVIHPRSKLAGYSTVKKSENFSKWATGKNEFDKHVFIGRLFEQVGQRDKAEKFYKEALKIAKNDSQRVIVKINLAELYYKESIPGKEDDAITLYTQCISSSRNPLERASLKTNISNIQRRRGKDYYSDSLQKAEEAKRDFESILDTEFEKEALALSLSENDKKNYLEYAKFLNVYGLVLYSLEKLPEARSSCLRSAEIKSYFGDVDGIGESENAVSIIFTREGRNLINQNKVDDGRLKFKEAIRHASTAIDSRRKIGNIRGYAQNCRNIAWPNSELMKLTTDEDERLKYFEAARDGYTTGISYWNRLKNPPAGEVVLFSNLLAQLYIDFCSTLHDHERKEKWIRVLAQDIIPRYGNMIVVDIISRKVAQSDKRVPTAENNLKRIKNLFEEAELSTETAEVEKMLNELSRSSE